MLVLLFGKAKKSKLKRNLLIRKCVLYADWEKMVEWVWKMYKQEVFLSDDVIAKKARWVHHEFNTRLPISYRTNLRFSNGWLAWFKSRNNFREYRDHIESGSADRSAIWTEIPILRTLLSDFRPADQLNADEFVLRYKQKPTTMVGIGSLNSASDTNRQQQQ